MGMVEVQAALVAKVDALEGVRKCYDKRPQSMPSTMGVYGWIETRFLGADQETYGQSGMVRMYYQGLVHLVAGGQVMQEDDARRMLGVFASRLRYAVYTDDTLGGAVFDVAIAPNQSGDTLDQFQDLEGMWPEMVVVLNITDYEDANALAS